MQAASTGILQAKLNCVRRSGATVLARDLNNLISRLIRRIAQAPRSWRSYSGITVPCLLVLSGTVIAQDLPNGIKAKESPTAPFVLGLKVQYAPAYQGNGGKPQQPAQIPAAVLPVASSEGAATSSVRRITLEEAQQAASGGANPMVRLGELQVEVAKQNRLGTRSMFFPQINSAAENFHFNKFMGETFQVLRPIKGTIVAVGVPLTQKDQTFVDVTATQPITPLFQIRELYKIARADENIARAKAGMPLSAKASGIEKAYYGLLVAQRQLTLAKLQARETENKWLLASNSAKPVGLAGHDEELIATSNALAIATSKVKELTASLNEMIGLPAGTELELVAPDTRFEEISLQEATDKALAANPEVVEAEQNVVKAKSASRIQKLAYVPTVAVIGGYAYQDGVLPLLPRDFSFVGMVASYTLFDFGKREHTIKGANAQAEMAELAVQLTKAKVVAAVKTSHLEVQRLQQLSQLTRRLASAIEVQQASYEQNSAEVIAAKKARVEAEMFQADLDYREALGKLKTLMGQ